MLKALKVFVIIVFQFLIFFPSKADKPIVKIYCDAGYAPYSYSVDKTNLPAGIYFDVLKEAFKKLSDKYEISVECIPRKRAVSYVKEGKAFGVFPPYLHVEERPWMGYSTPILKETIVAFCHDKDKKWPTGFKDKRVGMNFGFIFPSDVMSILRQNNMKIIALKDNEQGLEYYNSSDEKKRLDCYLNDRIAILETSKLKGGPPLRLDEIAVLFSTYGYFGYSKEHVSDFPFYKDFLDQLNEQIEKMKNNKEIEKIINKYISIE